MSHQDEQHHLQFRSGTTCPACRTSELHLKGNHTAFCGSCGFSIQFENHLPSSIDPEKAARDHELAKRLSPPGFHDPRVSHSNLPAEAELKQHKMLMLERIVEHHQDKEVADGT